MAEDSGNNSAGSSISNSEFSNYVRLRILLEKGSKILRREFINSWDSKCGTDTWNDSDLNRKEFINGPGKRLYSNAKKIQREKLSSIKIAEWDLPLLLQSVKSLNADVPYCIYEKLKSIRNKLSHLGEPKIDDEEYADYWEQIRVLLIDLGLSEEEIDQVKTVPIDQYTNESQLMLDPKVQELKDLGNAAFKKKQYKESIEFYTKAVCSPDVPSQELAKLYCNRSIAYLKLGDIESAIEEAKCAIHLFQTWWKGYYRLALAYKAKEKYQKAVKNLLLAQQFYGDVNKEINDEIKSCSQLINERSKEGHLNPLYFCAKNEEWAKGLSDVSLDDEGTEMCAKGRKFYLGQNVRQDLKETAKWYAKAAAVGNAEGLYSIGLMTIEGKGVNCDINEGVHLLEQAASEPKLKKLGGKYLVPNLGVSEAQHSLGLIYEEGSLVPKNYKEAKYWYSRAIKHWSGASANNLAIMYSIGKGVSKSIDLAFQYLKLGAAMGHVRSMENLAYKYFGLRDYKSMQQ